MEQNGVYCSHKISLAALILAVGLIFSSIVVATVIYKVKAMDNTLQVTGSVKKVVNSDVVKWTAAFSRTVTMSELKSGYSQMASDLEKVSGFLKTEGVDPKEMTVSTVFMDQQYDYYKPESAPSQKYYILRQTVQIQSKEVDKITALAKNTKKLIDEGVIFSTQSLEYFYTKLPETRIELLASAVQDAKARAEKLAESSGRKVGTLKSASVGVVQVLPVNSVEISDYGAYDTSSIEKEVMITVRALFRIN